MTEMAFVNSVHLDERNMAAAELLAAEEKLQSLCSAHKEVFVAVEKRGANFANSLSLLLEVLEEAIPKVEETRRILEHDCNSAETDADQTEGEMTVTLSTLAENHRSRRRILLQHSNLLELLELPSLMDACVRGHLYDEGLSIASFANTLEKRHLRSSKDGTIHGTNNPIIENVIEEIRKRESDLRNDLVNRLRADVSMPQCLEIITALRRLNNIELERNSNIDVPPESIEKAHEMAEWKLQIQFLEARDLWLESSLLSFGSHIHVLLNKQVHRSDNRMQGNTEKILDSIDTYRTRFFEIATQFLAIFRSTPSHAPTKSFHPSSSSNHVLNMWMSRRIYSFLYEQLVGKYLPLISDSSTLRDCLETVTFFASSLGRIGADFSPLIPSIFQSALSNLVVSQWNEGVNAFENILKVCRETGNATPLSSNRDITRSSDDDVHDGNEDELDSSNQHRKTPPPPRHLLGFPPLARLLNSYLTGLNELRRCLMPGAFSVLRSNFNDDYTNRIREILLTNEREVLTPGFLKVKGGDPTKLRTAAVRLKEEFDACLEPYMRNALEVSFGYIEILPKNVLNPANNEMEQLITGQSDGDDALIVGYKEV